MDKLSQSGFPSVLMIMLCHRCAMGGAEKRYARVFEMLLAQTHTNHKLVINRPMLDLLQNAGILTQCDDSLVVLDPPFQNRLQRNSGLGRLARPFIWALQVIWYMWRCWQAVHNHKPDVVHPLLTGVYFSLPAVLMHPTVNYMLSAYSYEFESYRDKRILGMPVGATLKYFAMQHCRVIDALSETIKDDLVARGIAANKIRVTPCSFTDLSLCQPSPLKNKWIVFLHRFVGLKNPLTLAQAIPEVISHHPDAQIFFLGAGYLQPDLEQLIQNLNITDYVTIRYEPYPTRILNESVIFVTLQDVSSYPNQSLLEAMACGNAILATDVSETWRLVDESNGIRIPLTTMTPAAVAQALVQLLDDPSLGQKQQASRQRVLTEHTPERYFEYITGVYREVSSNDIK